MVSFCCHFYGWLPYDCLNMPAKTFFSMHKQATIMEASQYSELADIGLLGHGMKLDWYFGLKEKYRGIMNPEQIRLPDRPGGPVIESGSDDSVSLMKNIACAMKGNLGYGRR